MSPADPAAVTVLYQDLFYKIMLAIVRAEPSAAKYARFRERARRQTKERLRKIGEVAGAYYVQHANPGVTQITPEESDALKAAAIAEALRSVSDDRDGS